MAGTTEAVTAPLGPVGELVADTTDAAIAPLGPLGELVSDTATVLTEPLANPLETVGDLGGTAAAVIGTVATTVDTVAAVTEDAGERAELTEDVGDVVASVPEQVLPGVLDGATDAILELPGGEAAVPAVELVDETVEALGPVTDTTTAVVDGATGAVADTTEAVTAPLGSVGELAVGYGDRADRAAGESAGRRRGGDRRPAR